MRRSSCLLSCLTLLVACGGAQPSPPASPAPTANESAAPPLASAEPAASSAMPAPEGSGVAAGAAVPGPGQWDTWTVEQKKAYMKGAVLPKMGALFQAFAPSHYAEPTCATCHGPGAKDGSFTMPNPALPKLPTTAAGFEQLRGQHTKIFDFMSNQVVPTMASLIGEEPYDHQTQQGFGCFECHTKR